MSGADAKCQIAAENANLSGAFKAWLSDSSESVSQRATHSDLPYVKLDGTIIAANWSDLTDGNILAQINITEFNQSATGVLRVWTGTLANGDSSESNCYGWTVDQPPAPAYGDAGSIRFADARWTERGTRDCSDSLKLYCVEQ